MDKRDTAIVDLVAYNRALGLLQHVSGEVSMAKILPIVSAFQQAVIPEPEPSLHAGAIRESDDIYAQKCKETLARFGKEAEKHRKDAEEAEEECPSPTPPNS